MSKSWIVKIFCCGSNDEHEKKHIPTPSKKQIKLWEEREKELREIRKERESTAEREMDLR